MKTFIYDIVDVETDVVIKENCVSTLEDEWTVESAELFLGGITGKAVNVKEIDCEKLVKMIIKNRKEEIENYKYAYEHYYLKDRKEVLNWRLGRLGSLEKLFTNMGCEQ